MTNGMSFPEAVRKEVADLPSGGARLIDDGPPGQDFESSFAKLCRKPLDRVQLASQAGWSQHTLRGKSVLSSRRCKRRRSCPVSNTSRPPPFRSALFWSDRPISRD